MHLLSTLQPNRDAQDAIPISEQRRLDPAPMGARSNELRLLELQADGMHCQISTAAPACVPAAFP